MIKERVGEEEGDKERKGEREREGERGERKRQKEKERRGKKREIETREIEIEKESGRKKQMDRRRQTYRESYIKTVRNPACCSSGLLENIINIICKKVITSESVDFRIMSQK